MGYSNVNVVEIQPQVIPKKTYTPIGCLVAVHVVDECREHRV